MNEWFFLWFYLTVIYTENISIRNDMIEYVMLNIANHTQIFKLLSPQIYFAIHLSEEEKTNGPALYPNQA